MSDKCSVCGKLLVFHKADSSECPEDFKVSQEQKPRGFPKTYFLRIEGEKLTTVEKQFYDMAMEDVSDLDAKINELRAQKEKLASLLEDATQYLLTNDNGWTPTKRGKKTSAELIYEFQQALTDNGETK